MQPDVVLAEAQAMAATGVDFVKVGLFAGEERAACIAALAPLAARHKIIGVLFADAAPDLALLPLMAASGFAGAMLDTAGKGTGRLLTHMDMPALGAFVTACKAQALMSGLAGALEPPDVPRLLALAPDFLGFRGALCKDRVRGGALDPASIALVRALIPLAGAVHAGPAPDGATDCIFVSDFTVPMRIGAYAFEHLAPQNVRFNIEADVLRLAAAGDSMPDVFSYDLITDGIHLLAATTAFSMVETLAERVAAQVLAHARVARVRVKVEKLDLGDFRVGVAIARGRV